MRGSEEKTARTHTHTHAPSAHRQHAPTDAQVTHGCTCAQADGSKWADERSMASWRASDCVPEFWSEGGAWADERRAHGALWLAYAGTARGEFLATDVTFGAVNWFRNSIAPPKAERAPSLTLRAARRTDYPSPSSGV